METLTLMPQLTRVWLLRGQQQRAVPPYVHALERLVDLLLVVREVIERRHTKKVDEAEQLERIVLQRGACETPASERALPKCKARLARLGAVVLDVLCLVQHDTEPVHLEERV